MHRHLYHSISLSILPILSFYSYFPFLPYHCLVSRIRLCTGSLSSCRLRIPVRIANGRKPSRRFVPAVDFGYGYQYALSEEDHKRFEGLMWCNEPISISQMRSIHISSPSSCATEISASTMVVNMASASAVRKVPQN